MLSNTYCCKCNDTITLSDFKKMKPLTKVCCTKCKLCTKCQNKEFRAVFCENCNVVTKHSDRKELDPKKYTCKKCSGSACLTNNSLFKIHVTSICVCCNEHVVVFYDEHDLGHPDVRYGRKKCKNCCDGDDTHCFRFESEFEQLTL